MEKIVNVSGLMKAIQALEMEKENNLVVLKEHFYISIKRINIETLLSGSINKIVTKPLITDQLINTTLSFIVGYISKKLFIGNSSNLFKNIFGSILQYGLSSFVFQKPEIVTYIRDIIENLISKNKK